MQPAESRVSYWSGLAQCYASLGPPLVPSCEDIDFLEETVAQWAAAHPEAPLRAILLGVTPKIAQMRWPKGSRLLAIDRSLAMARAVWPGDVPGKRRVICGDWLALPQRESSRDIVIGDGSINCLRYPEGLRALAKQVSRVLSDDGIFVSRCYIQPAVVEQPARVFASIFDRGVPSFHHFKFRLLMAMQPCAQQGVVVDDVYRFWESQNIDLGLVMSQTGWEQSAIDMMELYRGAQTIHTFPSWSELQSVLLEFFDQDSVSIPAAQLGECCPIVVLRRRQASRRSNSVGVGG